MNRVAWTEANNRYLASSLAWLRVRLDHLASETAGTTTEEAPNLFERWLGKSAESRRTQDHAERAAAAAREQAAQVDPAPALVVLAERMGLSEFERDTLLLCAAQEFDPSFGALIGKAQGGGARTAPTFALALAVLEEPAWDALAPHRPLRYSRLLEVNQSASMPLTAAGLRVDERIVNLLKGLNLVDERLQAAVEPVERATPLSASQLEIVRDVVEQLRVEATQASIPVVQLAGGDAESRQAIAGHACAALERQLYRLAPESIPTTPAESESLARLWQRETMLLPLALFVETDALEGAVPEGLVHLQRFLLRDPGLVFLGVRETTIPLRSATFAVEVRKPTRAEQRAEWTRVLDGHAASEDLASLPNILAGQFHLSFGNIQRAAASIHRAPGAADLKTRVWQCCRDITRPRLDQLAQRLEPKATWEELVLPDEQMKTMRQIAGQVRSRHQVYQDWGFGRAMSRGFGINALFAGESGTGKTMAAEVLANDLALNLYRIDLSAVVSKYIGETEKNLRKLFDAAEEGGAILFFDEADALFGKRSEVKDAHDRYANIEINYLLQRIEAFSGLSILATNRKSALDSAFLRRLRFIVNFPFPSPKERKLIWMKSLPAELPKAELDYDRLGRLNVSGGNIHSIVLNAAFLASQNGQRVTMPILMDAARAEMRKLERPFTEAEFR
jgi:hypothetical protein